MSIQLTQSDVSDLRTKGFNDEQISKAVNELNNEELSTGYNNTKQAIDPRINASHSSFGTKQSDDIARWQLELNDILEKAEHTLNGDVVAFENGKLVWQDNPNPKGNTLNKHGVQTCMKFLSMYVNRNTILADYTAEEINLKVFDFGKRFNDLIFLKYDEMGMDNEEKRKEYASIVGAVVDIVHSAYARAKDGRERESFRKMTSISQAMGGGGMGGGFTVNAGGQAPRVRGILNPMRYVAGKNV